MAMSSRIVSSNRRKRRPRSPKRTGAVRAHLLVLECDAMKLAKDRMNLGSRFAAWIEDSLPGKHVTVVRAENESEMARDLAEALTLHGPFRSILVIGHSNAKGLIMTSGGLRTWATVGKWLEPFRPEYLFLTACEAGSSAVVRCLFDEVEGLREIYASPVQLEVGHTPPLGAIVFGLLKTGRINPDFARAIRALGFAISGGQVYRWRRNEVGSGQELNNALWDLAGVALQALRPRR